MTAVAQTIQVTNQERMKAILVSRHELLPIQRETLERVAEIVEVVQQLPTEMNELQNFVNELKNRGIQAIVAVALPIPILAQLVGSKEAPGIARRLGIKVIVSKQKSVATVTTEEEAKRIASEKPNRFILATKSGEKSAIRVMEFEGWFEVKFIEIAEEPVVTP